MEVEGAFPSPRPPVPPPPPRRPCAPRLCILPGFGSGSGSGFGSCQYSSKESMARLHLPTFPRRQPGVRLGSASQRQARESPACAGAYPSCRPFPGASPGAFPGAFAAAVCPWPCYRVPAGGGTCRRAAGRLAVVLTAHCSLLPLRQCRANSSHLPTSCLRRGPYRADTMLCLMPPTPRRVVHCQMPVNVPSVRDHVHHCNAGRETTAICGQTSATPPNGHSARARRDCALRRIHHSTRQGAPMLVSPRG